MTDRLCEGLLKAIIAEAPKVMAEPENLRRTCKHNVERYTSPTTESADADDVRTGPSHFIEHELSALYNVTHGAGLAVITPAWMSYVGERRPAKVAQFARRVFDVRKTMTPRLRWKESDSCANFPIPSDFLSQ